MDVSWKNLVVLLRNNAVSGKTSCQSIVECVHKYELPDLFDEITTNYLLSDDLSTRVNSSLLLEKLCEKFSAELAPLLQNSDSDGVLLSLDNIDLCSIANDEANCLYSGKSNYSMENRAGKVYRKDWLQRQRQELMHRLGLEVTSTDAQVAVEYSEEEALLDESDLIPTVNFLETSKNGSLNVLSTMTESKDEGLALTDETWFARLVRFMVIGLVDQQWEVRHGCCLGLDGVIHGLFSLSSEETRSPALFLVNDILCCGLCLLGLDRFLDADPDNSSSAITPVKHMAARLVATMLACSSSSPALRQFDLVFASLVAMCGGGAQTVEVHWSVAMGGLTGLTHVAPLAVKRDVVSVCPMLRVCADVVCGNWVVDDLFTAVAGLLSEVAAAVQQSISSAPRSSISISSAQIVDCLRELRRVVTGLDQLCSRIAEDSTCYVSLWRISACVTHLVSLCAEICPTDPAVMAEVAEGVVSVQRSASNLAEQLSIFSDSVRHTSCSEITQYLLSLATLLRFLKCESKWIGPCWILAGTLLAVFGVSSAVTSSIHPLNSHPEVGDVMFSPLRRLEVIRAMGVALGSLLQLCTAEGTDTANRIADGNTMLSRVLQVRCAAQIPTVEPLECVGAVVASKPKRRKGTAASQTSAEAGDTPERADKTRLEEDIAVAARDSVRKVLGPTCDGGTDCLTLALTAMFKVFTTAKVSRLRKCAETADSSLTGPDSSHWLLSDESSNLACAEFVDALLCSSATQCTMDVFSTVGNEVNEVVGTFLLKVKPAATGSGKAATTRPSLRFVFVTDTDKKETGRKRGAAHMEEDEAAALLATTCAPSLIATAQTGTASQRAVFASLEGLLLTAIFLRSTIGGGEIVEATVASVVSAVRRACALLRKQMQQHLDFLARWLSAVHLRDCSSLCHLLLSAPPGTAGYIPAMSTMLAEHVARCHREDDVHDSAATALISLVAALRSGDVDKRAVAISVVRQIAKIMDASLLRIPSIRDILTCDRLPRGPEFIFLLNCIVPHLSDEALISLVRDCHVIAAILGAFVETARMVGEAESLLTEATLCVLVCLVARDAALTGGELLQQCAAEVRSRLVLNGSDAADKSDSQGLVARLFFGLTSQLNDLLLPQFPAWFDIALHGLGSCEPTVRKPCTAVFCLLVPLAPLAKEILSSGRNGKMNSGGDTVDSALLRQLFSERGELERSAGEATDADRLVLSIGAVAADQLSQTTNLLQEVCPRSAHVSVGDGVAALSPRGLRRYQWEGVAWLTQLRRCGVNGILADEMGLGKSLQALTVIAVLRAERLFKTAPSLIVCPASLTLHWEQEITKFFPPSLLAPVRYVPPGKGVNRNSSVDAAAPQSNQVVIVSYDTLRANLQRFTAALWEYVVLDEAHLVKNPRTATAQAVFALRCKHRVALTGTPVQNQVDELWSLMNFLIPDYLGGFKEFRTQVVAPVLRFMNERIQLKQQEQELFGGSADDQCADSGSKKAKAERNKSVARFNQVVEVSATGMNLLRRLHKQVLPFILRRTKAAVASELPSKTIVDVMCPLSAVQRQLYASFQRGLRLSDESLEQELRAVREGRALTTAPVASLESSSLMQFGCGFEDEDSPWNDNGSKALHPLQALTYLKLLSVHPCLAISTKHKSYRNRLLNEFDSSGKLLQLTRVLLDSGVMLRHEFRAAGRTNYDVLFAVDPVAAASNEDSDSEEDGEAEKISTSSDSEADRSSAVRTETKTSAAQADSFAAAPKKRAAISKKKSAAKKQLDAEVAVAAPAHRCLIFAQHKAALDLIESLVLRKYFPSVQYRRLDGDVPSAKRAAVARQFNDQPRYGSEGVSLKVALPDADLRDLMPSVALRVPSAAATAAEQSIEAQNDVRLLLMTTGSCGLGLNLTAADTVIFVEHNWNPFVDLQAMDRAHRIGQTSPVTVYRLLAESTIEARIVGLQGAKQLVASEVINEDNTGGLNSNRGFGGMLWDSLVIYNSQEQQGNIEAEPGSEEDINLDEFLSSVGQT